MPIEFGIWRIDGEVTPVASEPFPNESRLEDILQRDISILGLDVLLVIGRQVVTRYGKRVDLLAIDSQGTVYAIELKRDRTPRDVVAQALDYGSWITELGRSDVLSIYESHNPGRNLEDDFRARFDVPLPDALGDDHQLIIVASMLDPASERIVSYLTTYNVPVNVVFFRYFKDGTSEYLARSWLLDPAEAEIKAREGRATAQRTSRVSGIWNGQDYYVSLGEGEHRNWDDCRKYGFVSGGQGRWFSRTLQILPPGARVFVCIPQNGYVGVGTVRETATPVKDFMVEDAGQVRPILEVGDLKAPRMSENSGDPERSEYLVRVDWAHTVPREQAFWEPGLFANQNTACRLRDEQTIQRVSRAFNLDQS